MFAAQVLAVSFFRLPLVGPRVIDALHSKLGKAGTITTFKKGKCPPEVEAVQAGAKPPQVPTEATQAAAHASNSSQVQAPGATANSAETIEKERSRFIARNPSLFQVRGRVHFLVRVAHSFYSSGVCVCAC